VGAIGAGAARAAGAEGATDTAGAAGAAGAMDKTRGGKGRGREKGRGMMVGEGERGPSRTDRATAPDMATSPLWRAMGDDRNSPEEPRLMGETEAEAEELATVAVAAASEIGS
jgi:hypothetical protein